MSTRNFRTPDSYYAERVTRDMIEGSCLKEASIIFVMNGNFTEMLNLKLFTRNPQKARILS